LTWMRPPSQLSAYIPQEGFGLFMYNSKRHPLGE
jgi:hypothetical protein